MVPDVSVQEARFRFVKWVLIVLATYWVQGWEEKMEATVRDY